MTPQARSELTFSDWKALDRQLAKEHADGLFEGVGVTGEITVKGVRYSVDSARRKARWVACLDSRLWCLRV